MAKPSRPLAKQNGNGSGSHAAPEPKIYWAVLFDRMTHWRAVRSIIRVSMMCGSLNYINLSVDQKRTDITRDELIADFRRMSQSPDDSLVMLDNDHEFPQPDIVGWLGHSDFGITAALAFRRGNPYDPIMFIRCGDGRLHPVAEWEKDSVIQCDMAGHGAIAIKRKVFDELESKGFHPPFYRYTYPEGTARPSEDMYFGSICEQAGIPMYCDTRLVIPHLIDDAVDETRWQKWLVDHPGSTANSNDYLHDDIIPAEKPARGLTSIVIASKDRADKLKGALTSLFSTSNDSIFEVIVCTENDPTYAYLDERKEIIHLIRPDNLSANDAYNFALPYCSGNFYVFMGDDVTYTDHWLDEALKVMAALPEQSGLVGLNDGHLDRYFAAHGLIERNYFTRAFGGQLNPHYKHYCGDMEAALIAQRDQRFAKAFNAKIVHHHPAFQDGENDPLYQSEFDAYYQIDQQTFEKRRALGFPIDYGVMA